MPRIQVSKISQLERAGHFQTLVIWAARPGLVPTSRISATPHETGPFVHSCPHHDRLPT